MPTGSTVSIAGASLLMLAACAASSPDQRSAARGAAAGRNGEIIAIEHARIFDGQRDIGESTLLIKDGTITHIGAPGAVSIPDGARRIDHRGRFIMPGLVNAHAHVGNTDGLAHGDRFYTRKHVLRDLRQFQAYGVTTVTALGMNGQEFNAIRSEAAGQPRLGAQLFGAGSGIGVVGGAPPAAGMGLEADPVLRPANPAAARAAVNAQADAGVDLIKLWVDDLGGEAPQMQAPVYKAAIDQAHRRGLKVAAHIHDLAPAADLVASGVDIIAHGIRDRPVDAALVHQMRARGTGYIATLHIDEANYLYAEHPNWLEDPFLANALPASVRTQWTLPAWRRQTLAKPTTQGHRDALVTNQRNLHILRNGNIRIGFGTDAGALPQRVAGFAEHRELELMIQSGDSPLQALTSATSVSAQLIGRNDRGLLRPGKRADLVVLAANPLTDIRNTRQIVEVWQAGSKVAADIKDYVASAAD